MPTNPTELEAYLERQALAHRAKQKRVERERNSDRDQWIAIFVLSLTLAVNAILDIVRLLS